MEKGRLIKNAVLGGSGRGLEAGCFFIAGCTRHLRAEAENFCGPETGCRADTVALRSLPLTLMARTGDRRLLDAVALQDPSWPIFFLPLSHAPPASVSRREAVLSRSVLAACVTHGFLAVPSLLPKTCIYI